MYLVKRCKGIQTEGEPETESLTDLTKPRKQTLWQSIHLFSKRLPRLNACNEGDISINRALEINETSIWAIFQNYKNKNI
jgi:hypothetical protein